MTIRHRKLCFRDDKDIEIVRLDEVSDERHFVISRV